LRGRSFALLRLIMQAGNPLGAAGGGFALSLVGLVPAIALSATLIGAPGLIGLALPALKADPLERD
jgi:predicted MFS family arabinose efflux permease